MPILAETFCMSFVSKIKLTAQIAIQLLVLDTIICGSMQRLEIFLPPKHPISFMSEQQSPNEIHPASQPQSSTIPLHSPNVQQRLYPAATQEPSLGLHPDTR